MADSLRTTLPNMSGGGTAGFSYTALFMRPVQGTALTHWPLTDERPSRSQTPVLELYFSTLFPTQWVMFFRALWLTMTSVWLTATATPQAANTWSLVSYNREAPKSFHSITIGIAWECLYFQWLQFDWGLLLTLIELVWDMWRTDALQPLVHCSNYNHSAKIKWFQCILILLCEWYCWSCINSTEWFQ